MKNLILIVCLLFTTGGFSPCSGQASNPTEIGIKGAVNLSTLYTKDALKSDIISGFNAGFFAKIPVTSILAFQPELVLSTKGATITYNNTLADGTVNFNLKYLELPLLCVINVTKRLSLHAGPYVAYLIDNNVTNKANVHLFNFEQNLNMNNFNRIDAGIALGAGIDIETITMGMRYTLGLTKVGKTSSFQDNDYTIPNSTNGVISFYLSVSVLK